MVALGAVDEAFTARPALARMLRHVRRGSVLPGEVVGLSVSQARDQFSDAVNRAAFGGEITYVTRGRRHSRAAAIVPADLVETYELLIDREDGAVAAQRLADVDAGRSQLVSTSDAARNLDL